MKLTTTAQVSLDGVMQGPGGPEEDERGAFERGGWARFDDEAGTVMDEIYQRADTFLFAGAPTRSSRVHGERGPIPATARSGAARAAQVRGIDQTLRTEVGEHDRPLW